MKRSLKRNTSVSALALFPIAHSRYLQQCLQFEGEGHDSAEWLV